ncbi:MAG: heme exporter protein CcmD [Rhizobiales bacterium]|nr:heme exporter protein CcmD [Hyphomicrobiales bacterium]
MGEYGAFIWSAYGIAALVLVGLTAHIWRDLRRQRAALSALEARGAPRRRAASAAAAPDEAGT